MDFEPRPTVGLELFRMSGDPLELPFSFPLSLFVDRQRCADECPDYFRIADDPPRIGLAAAE
jgi:hypothetical protein